MRRRGSAAAQEPGRPKTRNAIPRGIDQRIYSIDDAYGVVCWDERDDKA